MWQFAVPILFMEIFVDTLLPSASFSLAMYATCMVVIPSVGRLIDRTNRWTAMKYAIVAENLMIVLSSALLVAILVATNADGIHKPEWTWQLVLLFAATLVCGGIGQVLNDAQTIGLERDWVVVIADGDSAQLAQLNTTMRRIDLACKILGPMAFGIIMDFAGDDPTTRATIGAAAVGVWNVASTPLEYVMTGDIYHLVPELATKEHDDTSKHASHEEMAGENATCGSHVINEAAHFVRQWREYAKHPVFLLSFSFCSLYMTVLSGGALNMAYLKWRGVANSLLGSSQGAGAIAGLLGTLAFPYMRAWIGRLESVAVLSVWLFWLCLLPILLAFVFTGESPLSDYLLLGCVVVSRMWLWSTDLAETQIMQEWIEPHKRGAVNAMQTATSQFFYILILVVGIVFSDPHQFEALVLFSIAAVLAAVVGCTAWDIKYGRNRNIYVRNRDVYARPDTTSL